MKGEIYDRECVPAIIYIPDNAVKLKIVATVMEDDDSMREVVDTMNIAEVSKARIEGDDWECSNVTYCLTEEGRKMVEGL